MEDEENYDDENDYGDNEDYSNDDKNNEVTDELENMFLEAKNAEDPIEAYRNVIEMETSNSSEKTMTLRSLKEICIIYLLRDDYQNFSKEIENLLKESKALKEEIFKTKLFDEILNKIEEEKEKDFTKYLKKMYSSSNESGSYGLSQEIQNFGNKIPKYSKVLVDDKKFVFNDIINEYEIIKEKTRKKNFFIDDKIAKYESMTINERISEIKKSLINWTSKNAKKFWTEWVEDYENFSDLPIFCSKMIKTDLCKVIGYNILINLYNDDRSIQSIGFNASMYLYDILSVIFNDYDNPDLREYTVTSGLFSYILKRLQVLTEEIARKYEPDEKKEKKDIKKQPELKIKNEIKNENNFFEYNKNSKGIGYTSMRYDKEDWDIKAFLEKKEKHRNFLIESIITFFAKFFNVIDLNSKILFTIRDLILESALLPCIENLLSDNTPMELEKNSKLVKLYFEIMKNFSKSNVLYILLKDISKDYKPIQSKSIHNLAKDLIKNISLYINHLNTGNNSQYKNYSSIEELLVIFKDIENNIKKFEKNDEIYETSIKIIDLTKIEPEKAYPLLLKKLVFDYTNLPKSSNKNDNYYYDSYNYYNNENKNEDKEVMNQNKILRLIGEFSNLQNSLPVEFTNSIFVRVDKDNIDHMTAIIFGSKDTPYSGGAFTFDIQFGSNYPQQPPHVAITSTGHGTVRFNPNLYSTGKVCLSLLGTWRGTQGENWNPQISTAYQVLISIQSIIMSDLVYFNEPGYERELGTQEGNELNEGYSNIVRYNNIRVCMIDAINNPPKGFENVIKIHFYLKKEQILSEVDSWIERAKKVSHRMDGLISSHNHDYANKFKDKNNYIKELTKIREELKTVLYSIKLDESILKQEVIESKKKNDINIKNNNKENQEIKFDDLENIDMSYDDNINDKNIKELNDDMIKDRYSRYIGALGLDAVHKQSNATIFLSGLGPLGIEIAKNIVLSGCKELILHDTKKTSIYDITGQFFLNEKDIGYNRAEKSIQKLQELNYYVKVSLNNEDIFNKNLDEFLLEKLGFKKYNVIILTECANDVLIVFDKFCRKNNICLIICDVYGCVGRLINDFGNNFQVIDKDGENIKECYVQNISFEKNLENNKFEGIISINKGLKHGFEDNDLIEFYDFDKNDDYNNAYNIFNKKKFMIKIKSSYEFIIDNIDDIINIQSIKNIINLGNNKPSDINLGKCRQVKQEIKINFKPIEDLFNTKEISPNIINNYYDKNLLYSDYDKSENKYIITHSFNIINELNKLNNSQDINQIISNYFKNDPNNINNIFTYLLICKHYKYQFPTLAAFFGGLAAQEAIKSITKKFMPINQYMVYDCLELIDYNNIINNNNNIGTDNNFNFGEINNKNEMLKMIFGEKNYEKLININLFQIGAGAIGCELLKNYATLGIGTGPKGKIFVTDPDIIEVSNLTRQFLFREKHLRLQKSSTAAAAAVQMNPDLKGHIFAKSEKLCEDTENIFNDSFFKKLNVVTNALDNVNARKYVDLRCTNNKICLLDSGTLGPKGHVQVIIPYKTENYASQEDPQNLENDDIPQCTLKMFPEEAIHCLEWARDQFGKNFTIFPQNFNAIIKKIKKNEKNLNKDEYKKIKTCLKWVKKIPQNLEDCVKIAKEKFFKVFRNNINKLLLIYPLDKKDKDGNLFWSLPKRPPKIINFDTKNELCLDFITAYSYLIANMFKISIKYKNPKNKEFKNEIAIFSDRIKIEENNDINKDNNDIKAINDKFEKIENLDKDKKKENMNNNIIIEDENNEHNINDNDTLDNIEFDNIKKELISYIEKIGPDKIPELTYAEFEKDNDLNGQIDLIYSMSGLRCLNYGIEPFDWMTCKLKAGKIIPALSTTTSCISALQTLELLKLIKNLDIQNYRNTFMNLAIPIIQASQPGNVVNKKICGNLYSNVWDIWNVEINKDNQEENNVKFLFDKLRKKYGIYPKDIFLGKKAVYLSLLNSGINNNIESLTDILGYNYENNNSENYVDISVTFTEKENSQEYLKNIPKIRVCFK